jgi:hypothetical protein
MMIEMRVMMRDMVREREMRMEERTTTTTRRRGGRHTNPERERRPSGLHHACYCLTVRWCPSCCCCSPLSLLSSSLSRYSPTSIYLSSYLHSHFSLSQSLYSPNIDINFNVVWLVGECHVAAIIIIIIIVEEDESRRIKRASRLVGVYCIV